MNDETREQRSKEMFGAPKKRNGPPQLEEPMPPMPAIVRPQGPQAYARGNPSRRMSEAAAEAAQRWDDLEHDLAVTRQERDELRVQLQVTERENHRLKDELSRMSIDRDNKSDMVAVIETQFEDVAKLLVDIIERRKRRRPAPPPNPDHAFNVDEEIARMVAADHEAPKS